MRIGHLIYLGGFNNRDTFNALRRRGHLGFLDQRIGDEEGPNRYQPAHALAIATFSQLSGLGLSASVVAETVKASWPDIVKVSQGNSDLKSNYCGIRCNSVGLYDHWGWPHPADNGQTPLASAHVDLFKLWDIIVPQIAGLIDGPAVEDEGQD